MVLNLLTTPPQSSCKPSFSKSMQNKEVDQRLVDDITYFYVEKKRLGSINYNLVKTKADEDNLDEAARICAEYEMDPAIYVQLLFDRMGGRKAFFSTKCLQGTAVRGFMKQYREEDNGDSYKIEITNNTLEPKDIWEYQKALAMIYIRKGEDPASVLMDSSLKFFAWFRILATPNRVESIIAKYKHIAKKELNSRLLEFFKQEGLDTDRLI
jgi:hypothetical protein